MFDSRTAESYKIFIPYPNVTDKPPAINDENYNNDCKKIMDFYGTELPKTSNDMPSKTTSDIKMLRLNATTIAVIIIIIIIMIVAVSMFIVYNFKLFKKHNTAISTQNVLKNKN